MLQTLENDLKTGACPSNALVCLVVDECHRATGDHAMANVVRLLRQSGEKFRVLALSATPGNDHRAIQVCGVTIRYVVYSQNLEQCSVRMDKESPCYTPHCDTKNVAVRQAS